MSRVWLLLPAYLFRLPTVPAGSFFSILPLLPVVRYSRVLTVKAQKHDVPPVRKETWG
jgi:hypothetical protein